jgi:hypothetical protein
LILENVFRSFNLIAMTMTHSANWGGKRPKAGRKRTYRRIVSARVSKELYAFLKLSAKARQIPLSRFVEEILQGSLHGESLSICSANQSPISAIKSPAVQERAEAGRTEDQPKH